MEVIGAFRFVDELNPQQAKELYSHLMEAPSVDEYIAPGQRSLRLHCEKIPDPFSFFRRLRRYDLCPGTRRERFY